MLLPISQRVKKLSQLSCWLIATLAETCAHKTCWLTTYRGSCRFDPVHRNLDLFPGNRDRISWAHLPMCLFLSAQFSSYQLDNFVPMLLIHPPKRRRLTT